LEVTPGIHKVDGVNANVYLVFDQEQLMLIDTGMPRNAKRILDYVHKMNRKPSEITRIVLTHCHMDHVGSAQQLKQLTNAKIAVHREDAQFVAGEKALPFPRGAVGILFKVFSPFFKPRPVRPDIVLDDGDKVGRLTVVHTPGHTPGSISLYDSERKLIFVGDSMRFVDGRISGPPKQFTFDMNEALGSIAKISHLEFDVMLSGHGEPLKANASHMVKEFYASLEVASPVGGHVLISDQHDQESSG
jgi:glyoxylase-like metal-dependent hydrolase (beta-lactamase superfamily II)